MAYSLLRPRSEIAVLLRMCGLRFYVYLVGKQLANSNLTCSQDFVRVFSRHREDGPRATTGEPRNDKERI